MALSNEDKKDVAGAFGKKAASAVSRATKDSLSTQRMNDWAKDKAARGGKTLGDVRRAKSSALKSKTGSFDKMNAERKSQGYKPKTDRATKGMYDFFDKYD